MHSTSNLEDGYFGSGKRLRNSISYHGKKVHVKEILEYLPDRNSLAVREKEIVNTDLLKDPLCMNISIGGEGGGFSHPHTEESKKKIGSANSKKQKGEKNSQFGTIWISNCTEFKKIRNTDQIPDGWHKGKSDKKFHDNERIIKGIGNSQKGSGNSQFGTKWITNGSINKRIKENEMIGEGWRFGKSYSGLKGLRWITNGEHNKRLDQNEILPCGWRFGKVQNKN